MTSCPEFFYYFFILTKHTTIFSFVFTIFLSKQSKNIPQKFTARAFSKYFNALINMKVYIKNKT